LVRWKKSIEGVLQGRAHSLAKRMGLQHEVRIWNEPRSLSASLSMVSSDATIDIVVPAAAAAVALDAPGLFDAMLAHEFGHALQNDTKLWGVLLAYSGSMYRTVFPYFAGIVVAGVVFSQGFNIIAIVAALVQVRRTRRNVMEAMRSSEDSADWAGMLYASARDLDRALVTLVGDPPRGRSWTHPSRYDRLEQIRAVRRNLLE